MLVITQEIIPNGLARPNKWGGTNKAKKVMGTAEKRSGIEDKFMIQGFKAKRSDQQREQRRSKRK